MSGGLSRDAFVEALKPLVLLLVGAVHDEGPEDVHAALDAITALPMPDDGTDVTAAAMITLAAAVNPNATPRQLWGWIDQVDQWPARNRRIPGSDGGRIPLAVALCAAGHLPFDRLDPPEQAEVVTILSGRWAATEIATWLDTDPDRIHSLVRRAYNRAAARKHRAAKKTA